MHLAIIHNNSYIACIRSCQRTTFHTLHNSLKNSWHKPLVDSSTNNRVYEHKLSTPRHITFFLTFHGNLELLSVEVVTCWIRHTFCIWFNNKMNLAKLPSSTTLLLVAIFCLGLLCDCLTIRDTWFFKFHIQFLVVLQAPLQCAQMEFSLSVNNSLLKFLRVFKYPCRIFLMHFQDCRHNLFCILGILSFNSTTILRVWILNEIKLPFCIFAIKSIASFNIFQLYCATDIASLQRVNRYAVCSSTGINLPNTLL